MHFTLTVADCVKRIRANKPDVVLQAIRLGALRAINIGTGRTRPTWRISEEDLEAWLLSRIHVPTPAAVRRRLQGRQKPIVEYV